MAIPERQARTTARWKKWLWAGLLAVMGLGLTVVLGLPAYLNSQAGRTRLLGQANAVLAPARLSIDGLRFSWWGPTEISGLALISKEGKRVVSSDQATWHRALGQILLDRKNLGLLTLEKAALDVERFPDGSIDLEQVLRPVMLDDPALSLRVEVIQGRLKFQSSGLDAPFESALPRLILRIGPAPSPTTWQLALTQQSSGSLTIEGSLDKWHPDSEGRSPIDLKVKGEKWPLAYHDASGTNLAATLEGEIQAHQRSGFWKVDAIADLQKLEAEGGALGADHPRIDRVDLHASLQQDANGWNVTDLEVRSPIGGLAGDGRIGTQALAPLKFQANLNLGEIVRRLPETLRIAESLPLEGSTLLLKAGSKGGSETPALDLEARWIVESAEPREETVLSAKVIHPSAQRWELAPLHWKTPYGNLRAEGSLDRDESANGWDYRAEGALDLDWKLLATRLRESSDPKVELAGPPATFSARGTVSDRGIPTFNGDLRVGLERADIYGLDIGKTAMALKWIDGQPKLEPIDMIVNQGQVHLEPVIARDPDTQEWEIRFGKESFASGIVVNDVVSSRVLSYVAPILERSTRVSGKISAKIDEAVFPLGEDASREPEIRGNVAFEDMTFLPGPLAVELLAMAGRTGQAGLRLNQPVSLTIADRRVIQRGLAIPIGNVSKVSLEGSVDFDKNLDLVATLPLSSGMLGDRPILGDIIDGAKVEIPIKGTLDKPRIDAEAFNRAFKDFSKSLLSQGLIRGASGILSRMIAPPDPNAPPPRPRMTAEERKAQRLQKQAERRKRRGLEP